MNVGQLVSRVNLSQGSILWGALRKSNLIQNLPTITNTVFVVALAGAGAQMTWMLAPLPESPEPALSQGSSTTSLASTSSSTDYGQNISTLHLFGLANQEPVDTAPTPTTDAPDTQLRLTLRGVFASDNPNRAWAIIEDASRNEDMYRVNATVPGGAILKEVHSDRIILLRNNRYETLRLPEESLTGVDIGDRDFGGSGHAGAGVADPRSSVRDMGSRSMARSVRSGMDTGMGMMPGNVQQVTPEAAVTLNEYKRKLETDPQSVMNAVRAEPYRVGGQVQGYRVFPGQDRGLLGQVGLQPGDVVTSVNGIALDSPLKGLEVMKQLSTAQEVSVNVLRNGVNQTFVVPVN